PDRLVEVRATRLAALRSDEDEPSLPRLSEPLEVPSDLGGDLGGERNDAPTRLRLRPVGPQGAPVRLWKGFFDAGLPRVQIEVSAPEPGQLAPAHISEGGEQDQGVVPGRDGFGDLEDDWQRNNLPFIRFCLT